MGEYVEIRTGITEIINIANGLRSRGLRLASGVEGANAEIVRLQDGPETLPADDDFTEQFLTKYNEMVPGVGGDPLEAHEAVRASATEVAGRLTEFGDFVAGSMFAYQAGDDDNAADISSNPGA